MTRELDLAVAPVHLKQLNATRIVWLLGRGIVVLERRGSTWRAERRSLHTRRTTP